MIIRKVAIELLKPSEYNPRIHSDEFLIKLERSINEFGYVEPIIWNERTGNVVGGHARLKILQKKGEKEVDVVVVDLTKGKEEAFNVALNEVTGESDTAKLAKLIATLSPEDQILTGLDQQEIDSLVATLSEGAEIDQVLKSFFQVTIDCENEQEQQQVFEKLKLEGYKCNILTL